MGSNADVNVHALIEADDTVWAWACLTTTEPCCNFASIAFDVSFASLFTTSKLDGKDELLDPTHDGYVMLEPETGTLTAGRA